MTTTHVRVEEHKAMSRQDCTICIGTIDVGEDMILYAPDDRTDFLFFHVSCASVLRFALDHHFTTKAGGG